MEDFYCTEKGFSPEIKDKVKNEFELKKMLFLFCGSRFRLHSQTDTNDCIPNLKIFTNHLIDSIEAGTFQINSVFDVYEDLLMAADFEILNQIFSLIESHSERIRRAITLMPPNKQDKLSDRINVFINNFAERIPPSLNCNLLGKIRLFLSASLPLSGATQKFPSADTRNSCCTGTKRSVDQIYQNLSSKSDVKNCEKMEAFCRIQRMLSKEKSLENAEEIDQFLNLSMKFIEKLRPSDIKGITNKSQLEITLSEIDFSIKEGYMLMQNQSNSVFAVVQILITLQYIEKREKTHLERKTKELIKRIDKEARRILSQSMPIGSLSVIDSIIERNQNWVNWRNSRCPTIVLKRTKNGSSLKTTEVPHRLVKKDVPPHETGLINKNKNPFDVWPKQSDKKQKESIRMGNLVLESLWKGELCQENKVEDFETGFKKSRNFINKNRNKPSVEAENKDKDQNEKFILHKQVDYEREKQKIQEMLKENISDEEFPRFIKFRFLRLLREKDFSSFFRTRGSLDKLKS